MAGVGLEETVIAREAAAPHAAPPAEAQETARRYPDDVSHPWRLPLTLGAAGLACYAASRILSLPAHVDGGWTSVISLFVTGIFTSATSLLPFSLGELLLVAYAGWIFLVAARAIGAVARGRRRLRNAVAGAGRRAARDGGVFLLVFYLAWGFNFARPPYADRAGWPAWEGAEVMELVALARRSVEEVNRGYVALHGIDDAGAPTRLDDPRSLDAALDEGWRSARSVLSLHERAGAPGGRTKFPVASAGVARLGIAGMYVPFTGEAHAVRGMPAIGTAMTMSHEKAHQRGIARESEANFLGFAAAALAPDPLARYAAAMFAHRQLMATLPLEARDERLAIVAERLPGVQRDLADLRAFWTRRSGAMADLGGSINDRFLTAQGIVGGTADYRRSVWLMVAYARQNEGRLMPVAKP